MSLGLLKREASEEAEGDSGVRYQHSELRELREKRSELCCMIRGFWSGSDETWVFSIMHEAVKKVLVREPEVNPRRKEVPRAHSGASPPIFDGPGMERGPGRLVGGGTHVVLVPLRFEEFLEERGYDRKSSSKEQPT